MLLEKIEKFSKNDDKSNKYYNDVLKIMNDVLLFSDANIFKKYTESMFKVFQNKRTEAMSILSLISNNENKEISDRQVILFKASKDLKKYVNKVNG